MKVKHLLTILLVSVIFFSGGCKNEPVASPVQDEESGSAKAAPDFNLKNYNGAQVSLTDYNDKIVVLEWFNYECPFVKYHYQDKSTMTDLADKYKDQEIVWLAINSTAHQAIEDNRQFAQDHNVPYPILDDRQGTVGHAYSAITTPHMFIIKDGKIVYEGAIDNAPMGKIVDGQPQEINYVDKALEQLTAGQEVSTDKTKPYGCTVKYADKVD